ncbi:MAG: hypothetical protein VXZ72_05000, partial [Chlamydiota bacterium]|nr:hypothetical protein [Chlamydiota bacterium]
LYNSENNHCLIYCIYAAIKEALGFDSNDMEKNANKIKENLGLGQSDYMMCDIHASRLIGKQYKEKFKEKFNNNELKKEFELDSERDFVINQSAYSYNNGDLVETRPTVSSFNNTDFPLGLRGVLFKDDHYSWFKVIWDGEEKYIVYYPLNKFGKGFEHFSNQFPYKVLNFDDAKKELGSHIFSAYVSFKEEIPSHSKEYELYTFTKEQIQKFQKEFKEGNEYLKTVK